MKNSIRLFRKRNSAFPAILTAAVLSITMLPLQATAANTAPVATLPGDVNGDGQITEVDAIVMQGWLLGHDNVEIYAPENADANGDNKVNAADLSCIKRAVLTGKTPAVTPPDTPPAPQTVSGGRLYHKFQLIDQQVGIPAYSGIIPDGWTAQLQSNWAIVNNMPAQENVILISPDGKAAVQIASPQAYTQSSLRGNGISISEFTHYLTYMNADQFIDFYTANTFSNAKYQKSIPVSEIETKFVQDYSLAQAKQFASYLQQLQNVNWQVTGYEGTVSRRQYQIDNGFAEYCCAVSAFEHVSVTGLLTSDNIQWETLNTVGYTAADQESFEKYYQDYETITANGYFTAEFYCARNYVATKIAEAIAQNIIDESSGQNFSAGFSDSGTEVSANDRETQERVFQAWDDYIKDEDRYTTTDGTSFTTSMYNETVAQDGDYFYVGSLNDVPDGYTVLQKT